MTQVARENAVSTGLIYKWRDQVRRRGDVANFAPVLMAREPTRIGTDTDAAAITVDLVAGGAQVRIAANASPGLVAAALAALR